MTLSKDAYQALEDIVGPENITEDPAILDSYAYQYMAELLTPDGSKFLPRPAAVIMPGTAEELQIIVKLCNKYKLKYKAFSTGWFPAASPVIEGVIQLDLRRMDRILEIDKKNMFAVVEPYVNGAQLQAEAMKVGLNCHMIGAGAGCSLLAAATSFAGHGPDSIFMGHSSENLLALEWVMPTGDILRTGSLGSGGSWFCGEGPGPSLKGIMRGYYGAMGEMGVFTKCALKLSCWPGPASMPVEGVPPAYHSPLPENFKAYTVAFPTWEAYADAYYRIWDSEIAYIAHRQFNMLGDDLGPSFFKMYIDPTKQLDDLEEFAKTPEMQKLTEEMRRSFQLVLAGMTPRDIEYKEKALEEILAVTGGRKVTAMSDQAMEKFTLLYLIKMGYKNLNSVYAGSFLSSFCQKGPPDFMIKYVPVAEKVLKKYQEMGLAVDCGDDSMMGCVSGFGGASYSVFEQFFLYDPHDKESVKAAVSFCEDASKAALEMGWPRGMEILVTEARMTKEQRQMVYEKAPQPVVFHFQRKIKQALDPNETGQGVFYTTLDEPIK
jgi:glycolate oxidase